MPSSSADAVVIGAGVIGASCAYHLARRGLRVVVLDRGKGPGEGSTGRATGGFRAQYEEEIGVRLSLLSREKLLRFQEELGVDPGYRPFGYLWLARTDASLERLRRAHDVQRAAGLTEARLVDAVEAASLNRYVRQDGVLGGAFCPTDGFIRPLEILRGYLEGARRLGVDVRFGEEVVALDDHGVQTRTGFFPCARVVNAGGAWAAQVAALAGISLPVTPLRRQVAAAAPAGLPESMPMTIWLDDGFHLRVRDGRVLLLLPEADAPGFETAVDPGWHARVLTIARERVRAELVPVESWAGLYEMSPDAQAIVGPASDRLFLCNGSSGHGVMHAPALGQLVAEWMVDGRPSLDLHALRPGRFIAGAAGAPLL